MYGTNVNLAVIPNTVKNTFYCSNWCTPL